MTTKTLKGNAVDDESRILHDAEGREYRVMSKREFREMMRTLFFDVVLRRNPAPAETGAAATADLAEQNADDSDPPQCAGGESK